MKSFLKVFGTIALILAAIAAATFFMGGWGNFGEKTVEYAVSDTVQKISVDAELGSIEVKVGDPKVTVRASAEIVKTSGIQVSENADNLTVKSAKCRGVKKCSANITVQVRPGTALKLTTKLGDVRVSGGVGQVNAHTNLGDVEIRETLGAELVASSDLGDIRIDADDIPASVEANTALGDVEVSLPAGGYTVDALSSNGDTEVAAGLSTGTGPTIRLRTSIGNIVVKEAS